MQPIRPLVERLLRLPYDHLSGGELLTRYVRDGDVRAFEALVRRSTLVVQARCRAALHDPGEIEEAAAEVFAFLVAKASTIRDPERIEAWLCRTAENVALNRNRKAARRRLMERPLSDDDLTRPELMDGPPPDVQAELREQHQQVLAEIDRLSDTLRRTLEAVQRTGSYTEAAAALGCTLAKVKQDVCRARHKLLARLRDKGILLPAALAAALFGAGEAEAKSPKGFVTRLLARKWVLWAALAAAGLGTIIVIWGASPSTPDEVVSPAITTGDEPVAIPPPRETLQTKNLRIFREEVEPKITRALGQLGFGEVHLIEVKAEGSEVICLLEGTRPFPGASKPARVRGRYCVLARVLDSELDLFGTGDWKPASTEKIVLRPELFGKPLVEVSFSLEHLGLRNAFDLLPPDERALDEINGQIGRAPAAEGFVMPHASWWCVGGNSRYLYVSTCGLLLARDGGEDNPRWRCIGPVSRNGGKLAANDESLFWVRSDGQILTRPADPSTHEWRPLGTELPGGGPLCASREALFCVGEDNGLWSRPIEPSTAEWRKVGSVPDGIDLVVAGERLYCLRMPDSKRELWSRPLAGAKESWQSAGDYPELKGGQKPEWINWNLEVWGDQFLAWSIWDDRIFARPVSPEPRPWRQIGTKDVNFLRRW